MKKPSLFLAATILFSLSLYGQQNQTIRDAEAAILNHNYSLALELGREASKNDSSNADAWLVYGQAANTLSREKEALRAFARANKLDSSNINIRYALAGAYSNLGDNSSAIKQYQAIIKADSNQIHARIKLAESYARNKDHKKAISIYQGLLEDDPRNYSFNKQMGLEYMRVDCVKQAKWFLHNAVNSNNRDINLILTLSKLYNKSEENQLAIDIVKLGLMRDSLSIPLRRYLGYSYYLWAKHNKDAIKEFEYVLARGDSSYLTIRYYGLALFKAGDSWEAIPYLRKAVKADPKSYENTYFLAKAYLESYEYDSSLLYLDKTMKLAMPSNEFRSILNEDMAYGLFKKNEWKKGIAKLETSYKLDRRKTSHLFTIASNYDHNLKDKQKALSYYEAFLKAINYDPNREVNDKDVSVKMGKVAAERIEKLKEDLHFEGKLQ